MARWLLIQLQAVLTAAQWTHYNGCLPTYMKEKTLFPAIELLASILCDPAGAELVATTCRNDGEDQDGTGMTLTVLRHCELYRLSELVCDACCEQSEYYYSTCMLHISTQQEFILRVL